MYIPQISDGLHVETTRAMDGLVLVAISDD